MMFKSGIDNRPAAGVVVKAGKFYKALHKLPCPSPVRLLFSSSRFTMTAKDTVRCNKTAIQATLSGDHRLILNKVLENKLITSREYNNLKSINKADVEEHVIELVDKILNKGEDTCRAFLSLLQMDEDIKTTYLELRNINLNATCDLPIPIQASCSHDDCK